MTWCPSPGRPANVFGRDAVHGHVILNLIGGWRRPIAGSGIQRNGFVARRILGGRWAWCPLFQPISARFRRQDGRANRRARWLFPWCFIDRSIEHSTGFYLNVVPKDGEFRLHFMGIGRMNINGGYAMYVWCQEMVVSFKLEEGFSKVSWMISYFFRFLIIPFSIWWP